MSHSSIRTSNPLVVAYSFLGPGLYRLDGIATPSALPPGLLVAASDTACDHAVLGVARLVNLDGELARFRDSARTLLLVTESADERDRTERLAYAAGYRKHPLYHAVAPYDEADDEAGPFGSLLEPVPAEVLRVWPLERLLPERTLHMDMMREPGRRSDAHTARYAFAAGYVKPGDHVLDVACGYGYGSNMIARGTGAAKIHGVDLSEGSIAYATDNYSGGKVSFEVADAQNLKNTPDSSVDIVISFETIEHVPDPARLLSEFLRVLRPGGRLIASVPNQWVDETGRDPNPNHMHVYSVERLKSEVGARFIVDGIFGQTAGGNSLRLPHESRAIRPIDRMPDSEWAVVTAMKDPVAHAAIYEERCHIGDSLPVALDFEKIHDNPWLGHALVSTGSRPRDPHALRTLAGRVLDSSPPAGQDALAAACVEGYSYLASCDAHALRQWEGRVEALLSRADRSRPSWMRWQASLTFLRALVAEAGCRPHEALAHYSAVSEMNCAKFHASLLTKKADAGHRGARLAAAFGDVGGAAALLGRTVEAGRELLLVEDCEAVGANGGFHGYSFYWAEAAHVLRLSGMASGSLETLTKQGEDAFLRSLAEDVPTIADVHAQREIARLKATLATHERRLAAVRHFVPRPVIRLIRRLLKV